MAKEDIDSVRSNPTTNLQEDSMGAYVKKRINKNQSMKKMVAKIDFFLK